MILSVTPSINNLVRFVFWVLGPVVCGLLFIGWVAFGSRLTWLERLTFLAAPVLLGVVAASVADPSMVSSLPFYGGPFCLAMIVLCVFITRHHQRRSSRIAVAVVGLALVWGLFIPWRVDGFTGDYVPELSWRWSATHESTLAELDASRASTVGEWVPMSVEWPGFRGGNRDSRAVSTATPLAWDTESPAEAWRVPIGPAWSSFAHVSGRLFTQEQRGESELVTCYDAATGELIWQHSDKSRFTEPVSGAGPRATPTFANGLIYAYGARALLNCLNAGTGECIWKRDLMREVNARLPIWGFSSSPLVIEGVVVVYAGGDGDNGLVAFDAATGEPAWQIASRGMNFSSGQPVTIDGRTLVLFGDKSGLLAVDPATGALLWRYKPADWFGPPICQPQQIGRNSVIAPLGDGIGVARLEIRHESNEWDISETWSSRRLKPSFNDFVYHDGHLYGFDQNIFTSVNAATGERNWKAGRFGFGQVLLLKDRSQLIVTGEDGSVILLSANPERLEELGRIRPMTGKTWNHPIVVNDRLYVRNGEHAVCVLLRG
jgi:outer membrane protein assembly factor BamB